MKGLSLRVSRLCNGYHGTEYSANSTSSARTNSCGKSHLIYDDLVVACLVFPSRLSASVDVIPPRGIPAAVTGRLLEAWA